MSVKLDGLKVFENRVVRRILGPNVKTSQETGKHCLVRCCMNRIPRHIFEFTTEGE